MEGMFLPVFAILQTNQVVLNLFLWIAVSLQGLNFNIFLDGEEVFNIGIGASDELEWNFATLSMHSRELRAELTFPHSKSTGVIDSNSWIWRSAWSNFYTIPSLYRCNMGTSRCRLLVDWFLYRPNGRIWNNYHSTLLFLFLFYVSTGGKISK